MRFVHADAGMRLDRANKIKNGLDALQSGLKRNNVRDFGFSDLGIETLQQGQVFWRCSWPHNRHYLLTLAGESVNQVCAYITICSCHCNHRPFSPFKWWSLVLSGGP